MSHGVNDPVVIELSYCQAELDAVRQQLAEAEAEIARLKEENDGYMTTIAEEVCRKVDETTRADTAEAALTPLRHELWKSGQQREALTTALSALEKERDQLELQMAEKDAILLSPEKWMRWCDHRVLERAEAAEAWKEDALKSLAQWHALGEELLKITPGTIGDVIPKYLQTAIPARFAKLKALQNKWEKKARSDAKGGVAEAMTSQREYYGRVNAAYAYAECADELAALLAAQKETP